MKHGSVLSSIGLAAAAGLALLVTAAGSCSSDDASATASDAQAGDAHHDTSSGDEAQQEGPLPFQPSNVSLDGIDLSTVADEDVTKDCTIATDEGAAQTCFDEHVAAVTVPQPGGSKVRVVVAKSLRIEDGAHVGVSGSLPLVLVSLGNFDLLGALAAVGANASPGPGTPGSGAAGGSYCGVGGVGAPADGGVTTGAASAYGNADLRPLTAGSPGSGLGAGHGGGAIQIDVGGTFTLIGSLDVDGSGGLPGTGGGSGGAILVEATTVQIAGTLSANGGRGGVPTSASDDGGVDASAAGDAGTIAGSGGEGDDIDGQPGSNGGGGAVGRVRFNTTNGAISTFGATISPTVVADGGTGCTTQAQLRPFGAGP